MRDHSAWLRRRLGAIAMADPPAPWRVAGTVAVGGLTDVALDEVDDRELVLTISTAGRGVFDRDGQRIARDDDDDSSEWFDPFQLTVEGIGPLDGQRLRTAGLAGGGLAAGTSDGWHVARFAADWPHEKIVLEPPGRGALWDGHQDGCVVLPDWAAGEIRVVGFAPSGNLLLVASSADLTLIVRDVP